MGRGTPALFGLKRVTKDDRSEVTAPPQLLAYRVMVYVAKAENMRDLEMPIEKS